MGTSFLTKMLGFLCLAGQSRLSYFMTPSNCVNHFHM